MTQRSCATLGCERPYRARGYCVSCYTKAIRSGELDLVLPRRKDELCCRCRLRDRRDRSGGYCRECHAEMMRESARRRAPEINARNRERYNPGKRREESLRKYGLTMEKYESLLADQGGKCAICRQPSPKYHVDHDHSCCPRKLRSCGKCVRGLLCSPCNTGLGHFKDNPIVVSVAAGYLAKAQRRISVGRAATEPDR